MLYLEGKYLKCFIIISILFIIAIISSSIYRIDTIEKEAIQEMASSKLELKSSDIVNIEINGKMFDIEINSYSNNKNDTLTYNVICKGGCND